MSAISLAEVEARAKREADASAPVQVLRQPPYSLEAEQSVLGSILLNNECFAQIEGVMAPGDFYVLEHREIYSTVCAILGRGMPADVITVYERGQHDMTYLNALVQSVASARHAQRYAEIVHARSIDRKIICVSEEAVGRAFDQTIDTEENLLSAQEALAALAAGGARNEPEPIVALMPGHLDLLTARFEGLDQVVKTGLPDLDALLNGGMRPGQLIVIGARPSMGKTTIGLSIARHVAQYDPLGALVLSMEMSATQINDATLAAIGNIDLNHILQPKLATPDDWSRISEGAERVSRMRLQIDEQPALRLNDVRRKVLQAKHKFGGKLGVVLVDYIQLMHGDGENRAVQIGLIANGLKAIAKQHGLTIIALAQCNREADKKQDGADSMSDLNESGGIEAAADVVALLHREHVRNDAEELRTYGQLRIAKNRIGATGRVNLYFDGSRQFFGSWTGPAPAMARSVARGVHSSRGMD